MKKKGKPSISTAQLKLKAASYCAYQERSEFEVINKLKELGASNSDIEGLLEWLKNENFQNQERFAEQFTFGRFSSKKWGKIKIKNALRQHRVSEDLIETSLAQISPQEYKKVLKNLAKAKTIQLKPLKGTELKIKVFRYLQSKGFEPDLIKETLDL